MRPFTTGELSRIKAVHQATFGAETAVGFTAAVKRLPSGATDPASRETVVAAYKCRNIRPLNGEQKERAGLATNVRAHTCKAEVNTAVSPGHYLVLTDGTEYRIHDVIPSLENAPRLYVLHLLEAS